MPKPLLNLYNSQCIWAGKSFLDEELTDATAMKIANEPVYEGIPAGLLRRMGKAVRMGIGAAMPLLKINPVKGIIIGTANGGMEDCIRFLNQLMDYKEGLLSPGSFVTSTANAIAAQIGLLTTNKGYNCTHTQGGLSFENALLDAASLLIQNPGHEYLVGGVDEISTYNYNIDCLSGWYRKPEITDVSFFDSGLPGSVAGEGVGMFLVGTNPANAKAALFDLDFFEETDAGKTKNRIHEMIDRYAQEGEMISLLFSGDNGDARYADLFMAAELALPETIAVARYKHLSGEFSTSTALALHAAIELLEAGLAPAKMLKYPGRTVPELHRILIHNVFKNGQQSLMLVGRG